MLDFNLKNKNNKNNDLAEASNLDLNDCPPVYPFCEIDSGVSLRENIAEVDTLKIVRFKDGNRVTVTSDMKLDNLNFSNINIISPLKASPFRLNARKLACYVLELIT